MIRIFAAKNDLWFIVQNGEPITTLKISAGPPIVCRVKEMERLNPGRYAVVHPQEGRAIGILQFHPLVGLGMGTIEEIDPNNLDYLLYPLQDVYAPYSLR